MGRNIPYIENHKLENNVLQKKCNHHYIYFPDEDPWFPCTDEYFYKTDKNKTDGLHPECKQCCVKTTQKNYNLDRRKELNYGYYHNDEEYRLRQIAYAQTPEYRKGQSEWRKKNPEKLKVYNQKHRNHDITEKEWQDCLKVFNNTCAYCGLPIEEHIVKRNGKYIVMKFHKDHVDDKGYNDIRNAVPSCQSCNSSKHTSDMEEWYPSKEFYTEEKYNKIIWWITEGYKDYIEDKPPYRLTRERNEGLTTYHWNLWTVDDMRNALEIIATGDKKRDLDKDIEEYLALISGE